MAERALYIDVAITPDPLDLSAAIGRVSAPEIGGIGVFLGTVRVSAAVSGNEDKDVVGLEYEAHPELAEPKLTEIVHTAAAKWDLHRVVAHHRIGPCGVGEPTVVIACGAPHRADALEACRYIIDELKATVPIWKREDYADGSSWVGAEGSTPAGNR